MSKANEKKVASTLNQDETPSKAGNKDTQMQSKPAAAQTNAVDSDARAQARNMATPAAPADDKSAEDKKEEKLEEADRVYAENSTNPSVGSGDGPNGQKTSAPPARDEVEEKTEEQPQTGEKVLRVKMGHPAGSFRLGRHVLTRQFEKYTLNEKEAAELQTEGPTAWIEEGDEEKMKADAKMHAEIKRAQAGGASDI